MSKAKKTSSLENRVVMSKSYPPYVAKKTQILHCSWSGRIREKCPYAPSCREQYTGRMGSHLYPARYVCFQYLLLSFDVSSSPGVNLVNSTTPYAYNIRTQTYQQPSFSFQTLQRMLTVNSDALSEIWLSEDLVLERQTMRAGTPLAEVIELAIAEKERSIAQSPVILEAVMKSLEIQTK